MADPTPMMRQYQELKDQNPDTILFFRLGDFYEMFSDDARLVSGELDLTLTTRDRNKPESEQIPMCGVPYHSCEAYIARLIAKGYKVAICEQTEDPSLAKGLVKRDIIRVVTPGTLMESSMLDEGRNNFICAVYMDSRGAALAQCDISTGQFTAAPFIREGYLPHLLNRLGACPPREALLSDGAWSCEELRSFLSKKLSCRCENGGEARFRLTAAAGVLRDMGLADGETPEELPRQLVLQAAGGLAAYLQETQKADLGHLGPITEEGLEDQRYLEMDLTARRTLELTETFRGGEKRGSLLWVLDKTKTPMGHRLLRAWLEQPLRSPAEISRRQDAVAALTEDTVNREELILALRRVPDLERLIGRVVYGTANGRDLRSLSEGLAVLPDLRARAQGLRAPMLRALSERLDDLTALREEIDRAIVEDAPITVREGGLIRDGYDGEVDRLRDILHGGRGTIAAVEARERERTGIRSLKVGYNKVFGYFIEVSRSYYDLVPADYIRKQTLANCERFITQELKDLEETILTAGDKLNVLEYQIFTRLREAAAAQAQGVKTAAQAAGALDVLCAFADTAVKGRYCRPVVDEGGVIEIKDGRHPVVERMLAGSLFVPNDTYMGERDRRAAIITGPNMAGKSTYMRQVALITLMAQMGSFVPAASAHIGVVDRIFTRIGASDDLAAGQSTFMVEMTEVSEILRCATRDSLLILDEIGRGTSTFDGMSIARAVLEYCAKKLGAKTLFATHYHELTRLEDELPGVANYSIAIKTRGEDIVFLRKIIPGGADRSYGIEVAKLAGLPEGVVRRARAILKELEEAAPAGAVRAPAPETEAQLGLGSVNEGEVLARLRGSHLDSMSPLEALTFLYELKQKLL